MNTNQSAFDGRAIVKSVFPNDANSKVDLIAFSNEIRVKAFEILNANLTAQKNLKWYLVFKIKFQKESIDEIIFKEAYFRSFCNVLLQTEEIDDQILQNVNKILANISEWQSEGSGWTLNEILQADINICQYKPLCGRSYIDLPRALKYKRAIINIKNTDNKCFMWSILAQLHPVDSKCHANSVHHYWHYKNELSFGDIEFPVKVTDVKKFEHLNPTISVNVFGYEGHLYPLHITQKRDAPNHVNLLLLSNSETTHYALIKDLDKLLNDQTKHHGKKHFCHFCLHNFSTENNLHRHLQSCQNLGFQKTTLPNVKEKWMKFTNIQKQMKAEFIVYADFECFTTKVQGCANDPSISSTLDYQKHEASGYCYFIKCIDKDFYYKAPVVYRGNDVVDHFLSSLKKDYQEIQNIKSVHKPIIMREIDEKHFSEAKNCYICEGVLESDKVRDHCHLTGRYRGASHYTCNLNLRRQDTLPVVIHNLRQYDEHLILKSLKAGDKVHCIPNNMEKFLSFSINDLVFIDSFQFLNSSLESLVETLKTQGENNFENMLLHFKEKTHFMLRKGVYPYDYIDGQERFFEEQLPSREMFYNHLLDLNISAEDYAHAQNIWQVFNVQNLGQYHDLYLVSDVLLLADVFENFRNVCLDYYKLDPAHYFTSPGLAWDACLKMSGIELELLTDIDMHLFLEAGIRGGVSTVTKRYAKANNKYLPDYDENIPSSYILYLDMNNLYGKAMCFSLPVCGFRWANDEEIRYFSPESVSDTSPIGYILEVDLQYMHNLHDLHNDYPAAPEKCIVSTNMLSPYCKLIAEANNIHTRNKIKKLIPNLHDKCKYVVHYRNLQQYLSMGMKLTKIHRMLVFEQSDWMKTFIEFNTIKRAQASTKFEQNFFKHMNCSVFGKTMENQRKRVNVKIVTDPTTFNSMIIRPNFQSFKILNDNVVAVLLKQVNLKLNKPLYVGFAVLDISKLLMYDFHYNYMKAKYQDDVKLLFTDTDSLCYEVFCEDVYLDISKDSEYFDFSNFAPEHFLYSNKNKKALGKMKDEMGGIPIVEFCGLRSKCYSISFAGNEKKTAKGVKLSSIRRLTHDMYKKCLFFNIPTKCLIRQIRSVNHELFTSESTKLALSAYDDKRYIIHTGIDTLAYGHHHIQYIEKVVK